MYDTMFISLFCFAALVHAVLCLFDASIIVDNLELVQPNEEGLQELLNQTRQLIFEYDLNELIDGEKEVQDEFYGAMNIVLKETVMPMVVRVPNSAILPSLEQAILGEAESAIQDALSGDKDTKIISQTLNITVPTTGKCVNTYKSEVSFTASRPICMKFLGLELGCEAATVTLDGYSCNGIKAQDFIMDITDVDSHVNIDGDDLLGKIIAAALKFFEIEELVHKQLKTNFDSIDFGEMIDQMFEDNIVKIVDQFQSSSSSDEFSNMLKQQIQSSVDKLLFLVTAMSIDVDIDPNFLTITLDV
eukprot:TRINITY_DN12625_c0_g3_i3.p1 TRINITY_DN12625_c0_g3~~TRINITY_DN12625_c0_g3_i3.p1  ORF type:complete len:325 (+),score=44.92 TRINITY_DN12625_c0_g3_i3:67-975(+)